jgi:alkylation response protein AidB-like acyl-CoA dehydrogenase
MDFDLTDEQRLLGESVTRFIADRYDFEGRRHRIATAPGWSREIWREMAELGLMAMPFAEEDGGFGGGGVETMLVMEALGRGLVVEPYLPSILLAGGVLRHAGSADQKAARVPSLASGERIMTLAHSESDAPRHTLDALHTQAQRDGGGWRLDGAKIAVIAGDSADELVVSARTDAGTSLFLVDRQSPGITISGQCGYDGVRVAALRLDGVHVAADALIGTDGRGGEILSATFDEANAALCAEAVGIMARTLEMTTDYLKTRQQFGVAIGSFQALQHRAVDMLMQLELARSMATLAALSLDKPAEQRRRNVAAAKAQIGRAGRFIGQQAVQLHGAIGVTAEYEVGHAFKRLTAIDALFGDADYQLDYLAEAGGLTVA